MRLVNAADRPETNDLKAWAKAYAAIGWATFPLVKSASGSWVPQRGTRGFLDASTNPDDHDWRNAGGIGIAAPQSGLVFVDLDVKHGHNGPQVLEYLESGREPIERLIEATTKSNGTHIVCRAPPEGLRVHMVGKGSQAAGWPGIDVIGSGYIVAEPTPGYLWIDGQGPWDAVEPDPPEWFVDSVLRFTRPKGASSADRSAERHTRSDRLTGDAGELATFRDALSFVDPDCGRDDWIKVGMAINAKSGGSVAGFELWDDWSAGTEDRPAKSYDARVMIKQWDSLDPWHDVQPGTLFAIAERHGWDRNDSRQRIAIATAREHDPEWAALFEQALVDLSAVSTDGAGVRPIPVENLRDLLLEVFPPVSWVVENLITPGAVCMIAGEPKTAKTWTGIEILVSLLTGSPVFGRFKVTKSKLPVFAFLAEDQRRSLRNRARSISSGKSVDPMPWADRFLFQALHPLNLVNLEHCARLVADIRSAAPDGIGALYLDPLRNLHHAEENSSTEMTPVWDRLRALRTVLDCPVIVTHHMGKSGGDSRRGGQRARGSNATHGAIDAGIYLDDLKKDGPDTWSQRVESEVKAARPAEPFRLELVLTDDAGGEATHAHWGAIDDAKTSKQIEAERWARQRDVLGGGAFTVEDMAGELKIGERTARRFAAAMLEEGLLTQPRRGLYAPSGGETP